jgi:hypothetical protein
MHHDLDFFRNKLKSDLGINWETPIVHLIPHTPFTTTIGSSSLNRAGGFSIALGFWWHITFPDKVIQYTLCFISNNVDGTLISINILKFITVIINYAPHFTLSGQPPLNTILNLSFSTSWIIFLRRIGPSTCANAPRLVACLPVSSLHC